MNFSLFYVEPIRFVGVAVVAQVFLGCTTVPQKDVKAAPSSSSGSGFTTGAPAAPGSPKSAGEGGAVEKDPEVPSAPVVQIKPEASVGLILGPGGLKTLAQIGVLRELERAQLPIRAVVGLEWGALIAGLFSSYGRANDVEWQLSKLKTTDLPESGRIFGSEIQPLPMDRVAAFLEQATVGRKSHEGRLAFSCPFLEIANDFVQWADQGSLKDAVMSCMPFPPVFESKQRVASPFSVRAAVKWLKTRGVEKVILVNVLPSGEVTQGQNYAGGQALELLWREIRNQMRFDKEGVDWTIDVSTRGYSFHEIGNLRGLVTLGAKVASPQIPSLKKRLGL